MGSLERDVCNKEYDVSRMLKEAEDLSCQCNDLKRMCSDICFLIGERR